MTKTGSNTDISKETAGIIDSYRARVTAVISMLQDIQARYSYLPKEALEEVGRKLGIPMSQVFSLATYYKAFALQPRGKHLICVCMGTACHVKGAPRLADEVQRKLGIKTGETTQDGNFTLELVNCLGACALGPLMVVDDKYYSKVTSKKIEEILSEHSAASGRKE